MILLFQKPSRAAERVSVMLRAAAAPVFAGDSVKAQIRRAATRLGLPASRAKRLWYRETNVTADEYLDIEERFARRRQQHIEDLRAQLRHLEQDYEEKRNAFIEDSHTALARLAPPRAPGKRRG